MCRPAVPTSMDIRETQGAGMTSTTAAPRRGPDWPPLPERAHRPLHDAVLTALGRLDGCRLLDAGCGVGVFLRAAQRRGALVAGTDDAVARLEVARWALPDADLRVSDPGDDLPFDSGTFDVATARTAGEDVLTELARVVRPGGLVAVGSWVRLPGGWAETFADHLRRLTGRPGERTPSFADIGGRRAPRDGDDVPEPGGAFRAAGLTVRGDGEVRFSATFPSVAAAWTAMLSCEDMLEAISDVGRPPVREAFAAAVIGNVGQDGTVRLPKTYRYAVATT
jgi:SAM-dependent methyltransferase